MLGCCNHVIALLFRVEAAVRTGATKPSSTSLLAKWNVPTGVTTKIIHKPITEMNFHTFHYRKSKSTENQIQLANEKYKSFEFSSPGKSAFLENESDTRDFLYNRLKNVAPDSCFVELMEGKRKSKTKKECQTVLSQTVLPQGVKEKVLSFQIDNDKSQRENIEIFTESLKLTAEEISVVEKVTKKQSKSDEWFTQREYRLTASKFGSIAKRMTSLETPNSGNAEKLIDTLKSNKKVQSFATDHGIGLEPHAVTAILQLLKRTHKKS